jgi:spore maturation protein CgeB
MHVRVLDCIASGILPIVEYRKDIKTVLAESGLPLIYNYSESAEIAKYYIENDNERINLSIKLKNYIDSYYTSTIACKTIIEVMFS